MNVLAIDTSNEYLSLALGCNGNHYQQLLKAGNKQSELILPEIDKLIKFAKINLAQIDLIAYNQGPGSFTGLRIGLSCALALGYANNCRLLPIPAFALYANQHTRQFRHVVVTLDARLNQIYVAAINQDDYSYLIEPQLINPEELAPLVFACPELTPATTVITGSGLIAYSDKIAVALHEHYTYLNQEYPEADNMLQLANRRIYPEATPFDAELLYLRNKVALDINEQKLTKRL